MLSLPELPHSLCTCPVSAQEAGPVSKPAAGAGQLATLPGHWGIQLRSVLKAGALEVRMSNNLSVTRIRFHQHSSNCFQGAPPHPPCLLVAEFSALPWAEAPVVDPRDPWPEVRAGGCTESPPGMTMRAVRPKELALRLKMSDSGGVQPENQSERMGVAGEPARQGQCPPRIPPGRTVSIICFSY